MVFRMARAVVAGRFFPGTGGQFAVNQGGKGVVFKGVADRTAFSLLAAKLV